MTTSTPQRQIPTHLLHLRRDPETGWPAPYINQWTSEEEHVCGWTIGVDHGVKVWMQGESPGVGNVDFKHQHMNRQRKVVLTHTCQVCRAEPKRARNLVVGPFLSGNTITIAGVKSVMFTEPWLCDRCLAFALDHCPGLIRLRRNDQIDAIRPQRGQWQTVLSQGTNDLHPDAGMAGMWAKIIVPVALFPAGADSWFPAWLPS